MPSCVILPNDRLSTYMTQGNLEQFLDRLYYYREKFGEVKIIDWSETPAKTGSNLKIVHEPVSFPRILYQVRAIVKHAHGSDFIRVFEGGTFTKAFAGIIASRLSGKPLVVSIHGHYSKLFEDYEWGKWIPLMKFFEERLAASNALVLSNSVETASLYSGKSKISTLYVDTKKFKPRKINIKYDLLYVGSLQKVKNIRGLLRFHSLVRKQLPQATLAVAGDGPLSNLLSVNGVEWLGAVKHTELPNIYSSSKLFVTLSNYESFGIPVIESQACGLPALCRPVGALKKVCAPMSILGNEKKLVSEAVHLLKHGSERMQRGSESRKFVIKRFAREKVLARECELISDYLGGL